MARVFSQRFDYFEGYAVAHSGFCDSLSYNPMLMGRPCPVNVCGWTPLNWIAAVFRCGTPIF
jgi:hypothetical protein